MLAKSSGKLLKAKRHFLYLSTRFVIFVAKRYRLSIHIFDAVIAYQRSPNMALA